MSNKNLATGKKMGGNIDQLMGSVQAAASLKPFVDRCFERHFKSFNNFRSNHGKQ